MRRVALILPVRNEEAAVDETMDSILASTRVPDEVIVADGMSTDGTVAKVLSYHARGLDVKVVPNPEIFPGGGRNAGAGATSCDILLFADFGNRIDSSWVERMVAAFEADASTEVVSGVYHTLPKNDFERCVASINYSKRLAYERATPEERRALLPPTVLAPVAAGGSLGCTRELWHRIGGFPDWLRAGEDKLFARKIHRLRVRRVRAGDAAVLHHMRTSVGAVFRQHFVYGRGNGQTCFVGMVFIKLIAVYGTLLGLLALTPIWPPLAAAAAILFAVYVYGAGLRKVMRHDADLRRPLCALYALQIVLARDCGTIAGSLVGWIDWLIKPMYRRKLRAYLGERWPTASPTAASAADGSSADRTGTTARAALNGPP